jgi:hypothetical protein
MERESGSGAKIDAAPAHITPEITFGKKARPESLK